MPTTEKQNGFRIFTEMFSCILIGFVIGAAIIFVSIVGFPNYLSGLNNLLTNGTIIGKLYFLIGPLVGALVTFLIARKSSLIRKNYRIILLIISFIVLFLLVLLFLYMHF